MNIYEFINSKDVCEYLQKIGYRFNPIEMAYIIHKSTKKSMSEKFNAYNYIISNMEDCYLPFNKEMTLKQFLHKHMELTNMYIKDFTLNPNEELCFSTYKFIRKENGEYYKFHEEVSFKTIDEAVKTNNEDELLGDYEFLEVDKTRVGTYQKMLFDRNNKLISFDFLTNNREHNQILNTYFDEFEINIPVPFNKGDIVQSASIDIKRNNYPLVYVGKNKAYFIDEDNYLYKDEPNYLDLEYYKGKISNNRGSLAALSMYYGGTMTSFAFKQMYYEKLASLECERHFNEMVYISNKADDLFDELNDEVYN